MIFTDRTITVRKGESRIDEPIVVYRGDYELEVRFTILNSKFRFMSGTNLIESEKASYGQLAILTPYGGNIFSNVVRCNDGSVTFVLTADMLNQIEEVGLYSFQIRLMDYTKESRVTIPPIEFGIEVREPIASEDHDNTVNNAIVGYSIAKVVNPKEENVGDTFDEKGNYNKTKWETGDRISQGKLNKIEDAIDKINRNEINDKNTLNKQMYSNFNVLQNQIDNLVIESGNTDAEVEQARGNYNLLNQRLNAMDETDDYIKSIIYENDWYNPKTINSTLLGEDGIPSGINQHTYEDFFDWVLNPLVEAHPEHITKIVLGKDQSGMYNIYRYDFTPKKYDKTVLLHACLHGNEYTSFFGLCRFLQELYDENNKLDPNLQYIKNHIKLVVCPILNPWGFANHKRQNVNGVDLNRNFDYRWEEYTTAKSKPGGIYYKGDAPFSEAESRIVRDMVAHLNTYNLVATIDFHTITTVEAEKILYYPRFHDNIIGALSNVVERFSHGQNRTIFSSSTVPTLSNYLSWVYDICSINPEWNNKCYGENGVRDSTNMTKWVEWAGNLIITMAKESPNRNIVKGGPFAKQLIFRADETLTSQDSNRMGPNGYNIVNSQQSALNSMETSKYEFEITQQYVLQLSGWIKIKAEKNTTLNLQALFYQKYAPEQNYNTLERSDINLVTMNLEEGKEYFIPVNQVIQGYHSNYNTEGTSRAAIVHFRIRACCDVSSSCYVNAYNVTIHGTPSDLGQAVHIARVNASGYETIFPLRIPEDIED